jgi:hypothetical protein
MKKYESKKDYYDVLGVEEDATREQIDRAYKTEARKRHPDGGGSEEDMKRLNEAHEILSDEETRKAYDAGRRPPVISYGSSIAYDPDAATRAGTLKIPVGDDDFVGLAIGAATCFALGLPFLLLLEMQWVFFLWPLRVLTLGALALGIIMAHSAMKAKQREKRKSRPETPRFQIVLHEIGFWAFMLGGLGTILFLLYAS